MDDIYELSKGSLTSLGEIIRLVGGTKGHLVGEEYTFKCYSCDSVLYIFGCSWCLVFDYSLSFSRQTEDDLSLTINKSGSVPGNYSKQKLLDILEESSEDGKTILVPII